MDETKNATSDSEHERDDRMGSWHAAGAPADSQRGGQPTDFASQVAHSAQALAQAEVGKQAGRGATELRDVAQALRQTGKSLENNMAGPYVEKVAEQIERASTFLRTADAGDVGRSLERFAKREPLLFLGGAFTVGLLGARFMKSSSRRDEHVGDASNGSKDIAKRREFGGDDGSETTPAFGWTAPPS